MSNLKEIAIPLLITVVVNNDNIGPDIIASQLLEDLQKTNNLHAGNVNWIVNGVANYSLRKIEEEMQSKRGFPVGLKIKNIKEFPMQKIPQNTIGTIYAKKLNQRNGILYYIIFESGQKIIISSGDFEFYIATLDLDLDFLKSNNLILNKSLDKDDAVAIEEKAKPMLNVRRDDFGAIKSSTFESYMADALSDRLGVINNRIREQVTAFPANYEAVMLAQDGQENLAEDE